MRILKSKKIYILRDNLFKMPFTSDAAPFFIKIYCFLALNKAKVIASPFYCSNYAVMHIMNPDVKKSQVDLRFVAPRRLIGTSADSDYIMDIGHRWMY